MATSRRRSDVPLQSMAVALTGRGVFRLVSFDESGVTDFPIQQFLATDNTVEHQRYPLSGEKNPGVALHVVELDFGVLSPVAREVVD